MKICLVAHFAYGALTGEETGHIGGVERQAALFSEWLANRGHEVSVITWNEGGSLNQIGKVRIVKLCAQTDGLPGLRFFYPRWSSLINALQEADAEVYYHNCAEYVTGQVALWCKQNNRQFVYSVASDADCDRHLPNLEHWRARALFSYGLKNADLVISQTHSQKQALLENFGVTASVIRMPGTPPQVDTSISDTDRFEQQKVVWVARIDPVKRIFWLLDIAKALPEFQFEVVGPLDELQEGAAEILDGLANTPNVSYLGKVRRSDMPAIYQNASLLCCTSIYEGFPNTYLEAWSYGLPVVTTIDPDHLIRDKGMGFASSDKAALINAIRSLLTNKAAWLEAGENARTYYLAEHQLDPIQQQFERHLSKLAKYGHTLAHFDGQSNQWADYYVDQSMSLSHLDVQARLKHVSKMIDRLEYRTGRRFLDLGCGTGEALTILPEDGSIEMVSMDYSPDMVRIAVNNYGQKAGVVADARTLPCPSSLFEGVLVLGVVEYIEEFQKVLEECHRVTQNDGCLIISFPNRQSLFRRLRNIEIVFVRPLKFLSQILFDGQPSENYFHQEWHRSEFERLLTEQGFRVEDVEYCTYGLLSPKLASSKFNLALCSWLNRKLAGIRWAQALLAITVVVEARVVK